MPPEIEKLGREELLEVVREQYEKNETLQSENDRLKKLIFGAKSERFVPEVDPEQTARPPKPRTSKWLRSVHSLRSFDTFHSATLHSTTLIHFIHFTHLRHRAQEKLIQS